MEEINKKLDMLIQSVAEIKTDLESLKSTQGLLTEKYDKLEDKIKIFEKNLESFQDRERSKNIILYGMEEKVEPYNAQYGSLYAALQRAEMSIPDTVIVDFYRLGKKNKSEGPRPLLIKLIAARWKYNFFEKATNFKDRGIKLANDLPKEKRILESKLLKARYILRKQGKNAVIKGLKLFSNKKLISLNEIGDIIKNSENKDKSEEEAEFDGEHSEVSSIQSAGSQVSESASKTINCQSDKSSQSGPKSRQTTLSNLVTRSTRTTFKNSKK